MSKLNIEYLRHILDEIEFLLSNAKDCDRARFMRDPLLQRGFTRSLSIIGEAAAKLDEPFLKRNPQVEWRPIIGMRNRLIHAYFDVDYPLVWDTVSNDIPILKAQVEQMIADEFGESHRD